MARKLPYTNFHDLNLDWIIKRIKNVYNDENPPPYPVKTVNGQVGNVHLTGDDIPVSPNDNTVLSTRLAEKYTKPVGGIPLSDLAQTVINTINAKYTKPVGGIPASDLAQTVIDAINAKYTKPVNGIPLSDLDPDIITDLVSAIIDDNAGYHVTDKTWSADKLFQMESDILDLEIDKLDEPVIAGSAGQVLGLNQSLQPAWIDVPSALEMNTQTVTPTYKDQKIGIDITNIVPLNNGEYTTVGTAYNLHGFWLDCISGDEFIISGTIGNLLAWAFIGDFNNTDVSVPVIESGPANTTFTNRRIKAPTGSKHIIIQLFSSSNPVVIKIENSFNEKFIYDEQLILNSVGKARVNIPVSWVQGNINPDGGSATPGTQANRCASNGFIIGNDFNDIKSLEINIPTSLEWRATFWNSEEVKVANLIATNTNTNWQNSYFSCPVPSNAKYCAISVRKSNNASINPSEITNASIYLLYGTYLGNAFQGKRISILGDSISTYAGENASTDADGHLIADGTYTYLGNHCRYPTNYMPNVNSAYWKKLIDELGLILGVNDSWAGSLVSWNGSATGSDDNSNVCISSQSRINHLGENGTPDYILVNAGTNDIGALTPLGTFNTENPVNYTDQQITDMSDPNSASFCVNTFAGAYRTMLIRLQKKYPKARVIVMLPDYTTLYYNPTNADSYLEVIKEACDFFGVPWVDMRTSGITMYNTSSYLGDGIHPNIAGMCLLANKMLKYLEYSL